MHLKNISSVVSLLPKKREDYPQLLYFNISIPMRCAVSALLFCVATETIYGRANNKFQAKFK